MRDLGLWLHVAAIMVAFATLPGAGLILRLLADRASGPDAQAIAKSFTPIFRFGGAAVVVAVLAGLALAVPYGFLSPWLVATYVLLIVAAINGAVIEGGWAGRLASAAPDKAASIRAETLPRIATWIGFVVWAVLLWLMVAKPGA